MQGVRRRDDVTWDVVDGRLTLYQLSSGELFELSGTGRLVWDICDNQSADSISSTLSELYPDQPPTQIAEDVAAYLQALEQAGLILVVDSGTEADIGRRDAQRWR